MKNIEKAFLGIFLLIIDLTIAQGQYVPPPIISSKPEAPYVEQNVTFTLSYAPLNRFEKIKWDFGDGTPPYSAYPPTSGDITVNDLTFP
jgi:hypothetical protein